MATTWFKRGSGYKKYKIGRGDFPQAQLTDGEKLKQARLKREEAEAENTRAHEMDHLLELQRRNLIIMKKREEDEKKRELEAKEYKLQLVERERLHRVEEKRLQREETQAKRQAEAKKQAEAQSQERQAILHGMPYDEILRREANAREVKQMYQRQQQTSSFIIPKK